VTQDKHSEFGAPESIIETQMDQSAPNQFEPVADKAHAKGTKPPLEWIRLELHPLPGTDHTQKCLFWNPETQEVLGEGAQTVIDLAQAAMSQGHLKSPSLNHMEMTAPLSKPSELAAVLAQHYWVIPEPVAEPQLSTGPSDTLH